MKVFIYIPGIIVIRNKYTVWKHRLYLMIFSLKLEIFGVAVQKIHQNSKEWAFVRNCLVKATLWLF